MSYIGSKPANKPVVASDLDPTIITGQTALAVAPADTDEFLISDGGVLKRLDASLIGGTNTPSFHAYASSDQNNNTDNTATKLQMNAEFFDSDSKYDTSNARFTPTVAGKYFFSANVYLDGNDTRESIGLMLYKNGSELFYNEEVVNNSTFATINAIIDLDSDDYVELYAKLNVANGAVWAMNAHGTTANNRTHWFGYKLLI